MSTDIARWPGAAYSANSRASNLDSDHKRVCKEQRPEQGVPELRTGLGVGRDAAWSRSAAPGIGPRPSFSKTESSGSTRSAAPFNLIPHPINRHQGIQQRVVRPLEVTIANTNVRMRGALGG